MISSVDAYDPVVHTAHIWETYKWIQNEVDSAGGAGSGVGDFFFKTDFEFFSSVTRGRTGHSSKSATPTYTSYFIPLLSYFRKVSR